MATKGDVTGKEAFAIHEAFRAGNLRGPRALAAAAAPVPRPFGDHSHRSRPVPVSIGARPPDRPCDENPLAGFRPGPPGDSRPPTERVRAV
jgi:hypothetical protein